MNPPSAKTKALAEEAAAWFVRLRRPGLDDAERRRFEQWLASAPEHRREYACIERLWGNLDRVGRPAPRRRGAAALAAALAAAAVLLHATFAVDLREGTKIGELRQVVLQDGTVVELDADTVLDIDYTPWRRRITLERGQAQFRVAPGWRPFSVRAGDGTVRDIGTTFNVWEECGEVRVAVQQGEVEIDLDAGGVPHRLLAGQQTSYRAGGVDEPRRAPAAPAWRSNRWLFEGATLGEVVSEINRLHERPVVLSDASLARLRVSGVFERSDRAGLLRALALALPLRVEETLDATMLRRR